MNRKPSPSPSQGLALMKIVEHGRIVDTHIGKDGILYVLLAVTVYVEDAPLFRSVAIDRMGRTFSIMNAPMLEANFPHINFWSVHAPPVPGKVAIQGKDGTVRYEAQDKQRKFRYEE